MMEPTPKDFSARFGRGARTWSPIGQKRQTMISLGILAVTFVPLTLMLNNSLPNLILIYILAHTDLAMLTAISQMMIAQLLPVELRGTGVGAFFNTANALFGGTALFVLTLLSSQGIGWIFYAYVAFMCVVALICVIGMRPREDVVLEEPKAAPYAGVAAE